MIKARSLLRVSLLRSPAVRPGLAPPSAQALYALQTSRTLGTTPARREGFRVVPQVSPIPRAEGHGASPASAPSSAGGTDPMTGERVVPPGSADIDISRLVVEQTTTPRQRPASSSLVFGKTFTDHMLTVPWSSASGWGAPKISPYRALELDPSSTVFHYAPCLFEGMKAYKGKNGEVRLFRPDLNMKRMNLSAARLALPTFDGGALEKLIKKLVALDADWIPSEPGYSLYIRPTMIGTQAGLGVGPSSDALLFTICSPVGPYYATGYKPVSLLASTATGDVRAWPGGTGGYKLGSNYATGVVPQQKAAALGYQQVLWLFGEEDELTEVGVMNLFIVLEKDGVTELVTPPLGDMILPGVTRDSILSLARSHAAGSLINGLPGSLQVSERKICMPELVKAASEGRLKEVFGAGTAAVVSSVKAIGYRDQEIRIPVGESGLGQVAGVMNREIVGRQTGAIESDWSVVVE